MLMRPPPMFLFPQTCVKGLMNIRVAHEQMGRSTQHYGLVHCDDAREAHFNYLLASESFTEEAPDFRVWFHPSPIPRKSTNILGVAIMSQEDVPSQDGDFVYEIVGRLESFHQKHTFRMLLYTFSLSLQSGNPFLACRSIRPDFNFNPVGLWWNKLILEESPGSFISAELFCKLILLTHREVR